VAVGAGAWAILKPILSLHEDCKRGLGDTGKEGQRAAG